MCTEAWTWQSLIEGFSAVIMNAIQYHLHLCIWPYKLKVLIPSFAYTSNFEKWVAPSSCPPLITWYDRKILIGFGRSHDPGTNMATRCPPKKRTTFLWYLELVVPWGCLIDKSIDRLFPSIMIVGLTGRPWLSVGACSPRDLMNPKQASSPCCHPVVGFSLNPPSSVTLKVNNAHVNFN